MSGTLEKIRKLVASGEVRISEHGYDELANDGLTAREVVDGVEAAILLEDYPGYPKGASVLVLQTGRNAQPVHVVWGIPRGQEGPAVLVTAYKPDPDRWGKNFRRRK